VLPLTIRFAAKREKGSHRFHRLVHERRHTSLRVADLEPTRRQMYQLWPTDHRSAELKKINAPILGIFGGQDRGIILRDVKKISASSHSTRQKSNQNLSCAGHAFENPNNKQGYRADDATDAWKTHARLPCRHVEEVTGNVLTGRSAALCITQKAF